MTKPWPVDAVMVVAALLGQEERHKMTGVVIHNCRECGRHVAVDPVSIEYALDHPARFERPVKYFCTECCILHQVNDIEHLTVCRSES